MSQPIIFNVQKFCVHDGPGIRTTVFFKGCPLHCRWCHNPESQNGRPELLFDREKCTACGRCLAACSRQAIRRIDAGIAIDRSCCNACGRCTDACLRDARAVAGKEAVIVDLLAEIVKDRVFYDQSGGGVTFSGGEALVQAEALADLAAACKADGIHVAVDTCGHVPYAAFERVLPFTDLFLYDIKHMDDATHKTLTGEGNGLILANLRRLAAAGAAISLRLPLIEGVNTGDANIAAVAALIADSRLTRVHLLPCHNTGSSKYGRLGRAFDAAAFAAPSPARIAAIAARLTAAGATVHNGG